MSIRLDSTQLVSPGILLSAYAGHGIRGADVPTTGAYGPSLLYPSLSLPADNAKEYRIELVTGPSVGTLTFYEDASYGYIPPPGTVNLTVSFVYRIYEDGIDIGTATETIIFGTGSTVEADRSLAWITRSAVQADQSLAWLLRSAVQADQGLAWALRSGVTADRTLSWSLFNSSQVDQALAWVMRSAVQADRSLAWDILNDGTAISDQALAWITRSAVQADQGLAWIQRSAVQVDRSLAWLTYQAVIADQGLAWTIDGTQSVTSDQALAWVMRAAVTKDRSLAWTVSTTGIPPRVRLRVTFTQIPALLTRVAR